MTRPTDFLSVLVDGPADVYEIAERLNIATGTAQRALDLIRSGGAIERSGSGTYQLTDVGRRNVAMALDEEFDPERAASSLVASFDASRDPSGAALALVASYDAEHTIRTSPKMPTDDLPALLAALREKRQLNAHRLAALTASAEDATALVASAAPVAAPVAARLSPKSQATLRRWRTEAERAQIRRERIAALRAGGAS